MISPRVIEAFLAKKPEPIFPVRGKNPEWLLDVIKRTTGHPFQPKTPWTGSDKDQRQLEAITLAIVKKRILLYYGMRVGKTRISLDWMEHLIRCGWMRRALVVPHAPVGIDEWEIQTPVHSNLEGRFIRSGPGAQEQLCDALESDCNFIAIAPPTLQQLFTEKRMSRGKNPRPKLYLDRSTVDLMKGAFDGFVRDEIHGDMWDTSLRHAISVALGHQAEWRLGLTGTPFGRDPFGLWGQSYIIDGGETLGKNFYFFQQAFGKQQYNHFNRTNTEYVFDPKKFDALRAKLNHMVLECALEEIQDVDVIHSVIKLKMSRQQESAYRELIDDMIKDEGEGAKKRENIFVRLRQVSSGFRPFNDEDGEQRVVEFPDAAKFDFVADLLSDLDPKIKVMIVHEFIPTGRRLVKLCEKAKVKHVWMWGGAKDRMAIRNAFQEGDTQVLIVNQAGGTGTNFSAADYVCVVESPVAVIARQQIMARPMARERPLVVDDLVCSPTEERILSYHKEGRDLMAQFKAGRSLARELSL